LQRVFGQFQTTLGKVYVKIGRLVKAPVKLVVLYAVFAKLHTAYLSLRLKRYKATNQQGRPCHVKRYPFLVAGPLGHTNNMGHFKKNSFQKIKVAVLHSSLWTKLAWEGTKMRHTQIICNLQPNYRPFYAIATNIYRKPAARKHLPAV
jgi:hypothetical protein